VDQRSTGILITGIDAVRAHLEAGAPWDACDAAREALAESPHDPELLYLAALANARAGAAHAARALLDRAEAVTSPASARIVDVLSLRGRLAKDEFQRAPDAERANALALRARDHYLRAYAVSGDAYPAINAATMALVGGDRSTAQRLAGEVVARLAARPPSDAWDFATLGEVALLLGNIDDAYARYRDAFDAAGGSPGTVATMRRQIALVARALPGANDVLAVLPVPDVVAFAGHMVDGAGRAVPRFPATLIPGVAAALAQQVARLYKPVVYTSAACGADLLFIEAARARQAEINIVLPFDQQDFIRTSVAVAGDAWIGRFDAALRNATRVIMATEEGYLGDDVLFEHAALLVEGFAILRAQQLESVPTLVCVLDAGDVVRIGGTRASVERWTRKVGTPIVIDLRQIRDDAMQPAAADPNASARADTNASAHPDTDGSARVDTEYDTVPSVMQPRIVAERPRRTIKTMLFADVAGYSRLHDAFAPMFQQRFLEIGAKLIDGSARKPLEAKTWGDAVYAVFEFPRDGAEFALRFLERMLAVDWTAAGLSGASQVRIALHAGPVFRIHDPITRADGHFGSAVTRAARIEPVTPPGMIYASEAFAAALASTGEREFRTEYVGTLALAKGYGDSRIYRLDRCR
jgi:hypothetical protein